MRPRLEVRERVAGDGGAPAGPCGDVHARQAVARDRMQAERIGRAQVVLGRERQVGKVGERGDVGAGGDARRSEAAGTERDVEGPADGRAQPLELERLELLARSGLDRIEDHRLTFPREACAATITVDRPDRPDRSYCRRVDAAPLSP